MKISSGLIQTLFCLWLARRQSLKSALKRNESFCCCCCCC